MNAPVQENAALRAMLAEEADAAICTACGTQFAPDDSPSRCPICEDERQYVPAGGQEWTSMRRLRESGFDIESRVLEDDLHGMAVRPNFAIGHRALIVRTPEGNLLWDAVPLIDESTIRRIRDIGGLRAVAASHPHFYTAMVGWSRVFGDIPIHLPESARGWVMRTSPSIEFYRGDEKDLFGGISLHRTGGHFDCSQVALWPEGSSGRGVLLSTDEPTASPGGDRVGFMYSFPNAIPLDEKRIRRVAAALNSLDFDRIYSGWWDKAVRTGGKAAVERSIRRYLDILHGDLNPADSPPNRRLREKA